MTWTIWTPNKVTLLRVAVGFGAVCLFGRGPWANLAAVALTVAAIALDALDGHIARKKKMATPVGAQLDILGDRMIENVYFTYFAVVGMVSLWLPILFFARGALTDFLRGLEPGTLCGDEMLVFLLFGIGAGVDARTGGADRRAYSA
jgi:phosphatidylglycerophosphate synthase